MWGMEEGKVLTSVVKLTTGSATVTGATGPNMLAGTTGPTVFLTEVSVGDKIFIPIVGSTGVYVVASIASDTSMTLTETVTGATGVYVSATVSQVPKYLNDTDKKATYGVDTTEIGVTEGPAHAGWVKVTEGTGGRAGRTLYETLVATSGIVSDAEDVKFPDA